MKLALSDAAAVVAASVIGRAADRRRRRHAGNECHVRRHLATKFANRGSYLLQPHCGCCRSRSWFTVNPAAVRIGTSLLGRHAWFAEYLGERRRPNYSPPIGIRLFRSGTVARPWERCCCAEESPTPVRRSLE
jgi:hypothetical protein